MSRRKADAAPPAPRIRVPARVLAIGAALLLAMAAIGACRSWETGQEALAGLAVEGGAPLAPALGAEVRREPDLARAWLLLARGILATELDSRRWTGLTPSEIQADRARSAERLGGAASIAAETLAVRPAAADAAMVLGAATYLGWSQVRDPRLIQRYGAWEKPLQAALAMAPQQREPGRFLAAAYLEIWPLLSAAKRDAARGVLAAAFREPDTFHRLIGTWLEVAPDRETAFALVPDDPEAWSRLGEVFSQRHDWEGMGEARARWRKALRLHLGADLVEAEARMGAGDAATARALFLAVASRSEHDVRYAGLLSRALAECPPGPVESVTAAKLSEQLEWVLDRCQVTDCPLPATTLRRLTRFCRDLPAPQAALAALEAGDLDGAERLERRAQAQWSEPWAPYLVAKAELLVARGRLDQAALALDQVHRNWQGKPAYWLARRELARAADDRPAEVTAERQVAALGAAAWPRTAWSWRRGQARLEMLTAVPAASVSIGIDEAPPAGALLEVRLDGAVLGSVAATAGATVTLAASLPPGLHLLEIDSVAGGSVLPGGVALAGSAAAGPASPGGLEAPTAGLR